MEWRGEERRGEERRGKMQKKKTQRETIKNAREKVKPSIKAKYRKELGTGIVKRNH